MEAKATVKRSLDGKEYIPGITVNGDFRPIGPGCLSQNMAIRLANKRMSAIEAFVAVCVKPLAA